MNNHDQMYRERVGGILERITGADFEYERLQQDLFRAGADMLERRVPVEERRAVMAGFRRRAEAIHAGIVEAYRMAVDEVKKDRRGGPKSHYRVAYSIYQRTEYAWKVWFVGAHPEYRIKGSDPVPATFEEWEAKESTLDGFEYEMDGDIGLYPGPEDGLSRAVLERRLPVNDGEVAILGGLGIEITGSRECGGWHHYDLLVDCGLAPDGAETRNMPLGIMAELARAIEASAGCTAVIDSLDVDALEPRGDPKRSDDEWMRRGLEMMSMLFDTLDLHGGIDLPITATSAGHTARSSGSGGSDREEEIARALGCSYERDDSITKSCTGLAGYSQRGGKEEYDAEFTIYGPLDGTDVERLSEQGVEVVATHPRAGGLWHVVCRGIHEADSYQTPSGFWGWTAKGLDDHSGEEWYEKVVAEGPESERSRFNSRPLKYSIRDMRGGYVVWHFAERADWLESEEPPELELPELELPA